jgi:hypothetical protein
MLYMLLEDQFAKKHVKTIEFYTNAKINNLEWGTHDRWINHHLLFRNKFISSAYKEMKRLNDRLRSRFSFAPVAQLDRVPGYCEPRDRGSKLLWVRH